MTHTETCNIHKTEGRCDCKNTANMEHNTNNNIDIPLTSGNLVPTPDKEIEQKEFPKEELIEAIKKYLPKDIQLHMWNNVDKIYSLGQSNMKERATELIEQRRLIEAGFTTESLRFKQVFNRTLDSLLSALNNL